MRRLFQILLLGVLAVGTPRPTTAYGATVPQTSAKDYHFSRPNLPSNIVGRVMGSPPAYHVMRSEDIAWLREAYAERAALASASWATNLLSPVVSLAPEYGTWPLAETNRFLVWTTATGLRDGNVVTNVIVGYNYVTNWGTGVDSARIKRVALWDNAWLLGNTNHDQYSYLSTDNRAYELDDQAWEIKTDEDGFTGPDFGARAVTNVETRTVEQWAWTNCQSVIEMTLTNGTRNVYTNSWRAFGMTNEVTETTTNVWPRHADFAYHIFTNGVVAGYGRAAPGDLRGPYDSAAISNHYEFLRGMTRLARLATSTNGTLRVIEHITSHSSVSGDDSWDGSNGTANLPYVEYRAARGDGHEYVWEDGETYQDEGTWNLESFNNSSTHRTHTSGTQRYFIPGGAAMVAGGQLALRGTMLFAEATVEYSEGYSVKGKDISRGSGTNRSWYVVLPVGGVRTDHDETRVWFDASLNDLPGRAVDAAGAPSLPEGDSLPSHKYELPDAWHNDDPAFHESVPASRGASQSWKARVTGLLLLLDFAPRASLPGWND